MYVHKILGPQKINIPTHSSPFSAFTFLFQYIYPPPISQSLCNLLFLATFFLFVSHQKNKCGMMSIRSGSGRSSNSNDNDDNSRLVVAHHHPPGCFSASQWQELEHQALVFKYMISGIPIPPDLLRTSCSLLHNNTHLNGSWNRFEMGRKIDTEPGRCRRTDGKKWRCSKEAYPDSKYCERHMHRGRNRSSTGTSSSRKQQITPPPPPPPPNPNPIIKNTLPHFLSKYSSGFSSQQDINSYFLHPNYRSNPGSNMVRSSISSTDHNDVDSSSSSKLTMALMGHSSLFPHAKHNMSTLSSDVARGHKNQQQHQPEKVMHHFLDERSTKDEQGSDSDRTTQLSISIPNYLHDFFITQKCKQRFWEEFESMGEKQSTLRLWWDTSIL